MIKLDVSNYQPPFSHFNGQSTINISPLDVARGILTVGQGSWNDVFNLGIFRIGEQICKALAFTKLQNGSLVLQDRFFKLNQSEKIAISYYIGQGLTKLYAEDKFKIKWLFHVDDLENISFYERGKAKSKVIVGRSTKNACRPDLIGLKGLNRTHIFEAKGRSGFNINELQHAINQVSQVISCNGNTPLTRTACYFDLSNSPIHGIIVDPENDNNGIKIDFDEKKTISTFYSFFRENRSSFRTEKIVDGYKFLTTQVGVPRLHFGFDKRILDLVTHDMINKDLYTDDELNVLKEQQDLSLGLDGIILINE